MRRDHKFAEFEWRRTTHFAPRAQTPVRAPVKWYQFWLWRV